MKRKTMMVSIGCVLIFLVVGMIWYWAGEVRPLKDIDVASLDKMTIAYHVEWIETSEQEDIREAALALQSMHLRRAIPLDYDGFNASIDFYNQDGSTSWVTIRGDDIIINHKYYRCDKDYSDDFRKVIEKIAKNPKTIHHES